METSMTKPNVRTITKEALIQKMGQDDDVQIVNVLDPKHYYMGSIKGSIKIPLEELNRRIKELDKNKAVVTYCAGYECAASAKAADLLASQGFTVSAYEGGIKEWKQAGLPME